MNDKQKGIVLEALRGNSDCTSSAIFVVEHIQTDEDKEKGIRPR